MDARVRASRIRRTAELVSGVTGDDRVESLFAAEFAYDEAIDAEPLHLAAMTILELRRPGRPSLRVTRYLSVAATFEPVIDLREPADSRARFDPDRAARFSPHVGDRSARGNPSGFVPA